jgi:hypothetical protein
LAAHWCAGSKAARNSAEARSFDRPANQAGDTDKKNNPTVKVIIPMDAWTILRFSAAPHIWHSQCKSDGNGVT